MSCDVMSFDVMSCDVIQRDMMPRGAIERGRRTGMGPQSRNRTYNSTHIMYTTNYETDRYADTQLNRQIDK